MHEIVEGLLSGLSVKQVQAYAKPGIFPEEMKKIREYIAVPEDSVRGKLIRMHAGEKLEKVQAQRSISGISVNDKLKELEKNKKLITEKTGSDKIK